MLCATVIISLIPVFNVDSNPKISVESKEKYF